MNFKEKELEKLKRSIIVMMDFSRVQLQKAKEALYTGNLDLAEEVIYNEYRVNALEISIDTECENILALYQPVATDLRLVTAILKCVTSVERVGDHANGIAKLVVNTEGKFEGKHLKLLGLEEVFDRVDLMLRNVADAFETENTQLARSVFKLDKLIDKANKKSPELIANAIAETASDETRIQLLYLLRITGKLERVGDLAKNIAEEIIFYHEAKILKHSRKHKKTHDIKGDGEDVIPPSIN